MLRNIIGTVAFVLATTLAGAQSLTSTSSTICSGASVNISITGGYPCGAANVSSTYGWVINPAPATISYIQNGSGYYNQIQATWTTSNPLGMAVSIYAHYTCDQSGATGTTNAVNFTVYPTVTPSVSFSFGSSTTVCQGAGSIQLNASGTNGGSSPTYYYFVDGSQVGTGSSTSFTYNTSGLAAGSHTAYVAMNSGACTSGSSYVTSSSQSFTVQARSTYTVSMYNPGTLCATSPNFNTSVTVSGGVGNLSYQWYKIVPGYSAALMSTTTVPNYSYANVNSGDQVYCTVTSDYWCVTSPASSSPITVSVIQPSTPGVGIQFSPSSYCENAVIQFNAAVSGASASGATYEWYLNGSLLANTSSSLSLTAKASALPGYFYPGATLRVKASGITPLSGQCLANNYVWSSAADNWSPPITVTAYPNANFSPSGTVKICAACSQTFTAPTGSGYTYQWKKNGSNVAGATAFTYNTNQAGNYALTVSVNGCATNSPSFPNTATLQINVPPTANAGADQTINIPASRTVSISGSGTDTDGSISTYSWTKIAGPTVTLAGTNTTTLTINNSVVGTFTFRLTVTDNTGDTASDDVIITLANPLPVVNAGADQTINIPDNRTLSITGSASDANGTISSYAWTQVGGGALTLSGQTTTQLTIANAVPGAYTFRLTATDNLGGSAYDDVIINLVNPVPVVNAGVDQTFTIPLNSVTFSGSATDNNTISSYLWTKLSGPTVGLTNANTATLTLNNVVTGVYTFQLKTTDVLGGFGTDDVVITVNFPVNNYNFVKEIGVTVPGVTSYNAAASLAIGPRTESITYYDGLGRTMEQVTTQGSPAIPAAKDIVQPIEYDEFGREVKKYLPFTSVEATGDYKTNPLGTSGNYTTSPQYLFYNNGATDKVVDNTRPFAETVFEESPLNRPDKDFGPGIEWYSANKFVKHNYLVNEHGTGAGQEKIINWVVDPSEVPVRSTLNGGYYASNQLQIKSTIDERGFETRDYMDKLGRTILRKIQYVTSPTLSNQEHWTQTYYVYDDLGLLRFVLQPELVRQLAADDTSFPNLNQRNNFVFSYKYDERGRMIRKFIPGSDWVYSVYDSRDRLLMTQDGKQRAANQWSYTRYDIQNRPIVTGIYTHTASIDEVAMSTLVSTTVMYETYSGTGASHGYTTNMYGTLASANFEVLTVNYYDDYAFKTLIANAEFDYKADRYADQYKFDVAGNPFKWTTGHTTGAKIKVLGTASTYLWTVSYYDDKYRVVQTTSTNTKGGINRITNVYDFVKLLKTKTEHVTTGGTQTIARRFFYDHMGRALKTMYKLNDQPEIILSLNEYNALGALVTKKLHAQADPLISQQDVNYSSGSIDVAQYTGQRAVVAATSVNLKPGFAVPAGKTFTARTEKVWATGDPVPANSAFAQVVDYRYNIRGWLSRINNSDLSADAGADPKDYFGMNLLYEQADANLSNTQQYNGNVAAMKWSVGLGEGSVKERAYSYAYDPLNRLTAATFKQNTTAWAAAANNGFNESNYTYDHNGNIKTLLRYDQRGSTGPLDDLTYSYTPGAADTQSNRLLYVTDAGDKLGGFNDATTLGDYTYDANGNMVTDLNKGIVSNITYNYLNLPVLVSKAGNSILYTYDATGRKLAQTTTYNGDQKKVEYEGEFQYENDVLQSVATEEGRILLTNTKLVYFDHGEVTSSMTPVTASLSTYTQGTNKYVKVVASGSIANAGANPVGGTLPVVAGERYKIRLKAYRDKGTAGSSSPAFLKVQTNSIAYGLGTQLPVDANNEAWVEQTVVVPAGHTQLTISVTWPSVTAGEALYFNELEVSKLSTQEPEYQYFMKDHLGNVRLTFTTRNGSDEAQATLEAANVNTETTQFIRYNMAKRVNAAIFDHTNGAATGYAVRLNGSTNERIGLTRSLSVMPGDTIKAEVYAKYVDTNTSNWTVAFNTLMSQVAAGTAGVVVDGGGYASSGSTALPVPPIDHTAETGTAPKAYINYVFINRAFELSSLRLLATRMTTTAKESGSDVPHEKLTLTDIVKEPGYVYVYLSNDNGSVVDVYFDDFKVTNAQSRIVQQDDYYAFGLTFNSVVRENGLSNEYLYKGKELQDELALNTFDFGWRQYDPTSARWNVVDQLAEKYHTTSPYTFVANNPMSNREIDGRYFEGKDVKKAERIERRAERRADKLERKAARIETRGGNSGDMRARAGELRQSGQDIRNMRSDQTTQYRYAKSGGSESKQLGLGGPTTTLTGQNARGHNVVTMFTQSNMGSKLHESRHGGQNARGEYNIATGAGYSVADEVSAYRAQYSWSGQLQYRDQPTEAVMMQRLLAGKDPTIGIINNINQINGNVVNSMVDPGFYPIYPPRDNRGNLIIPLDVWNRN